MVWVDAFVALAMHELALLQGGGAEGLRDRNLLESALARPQMQAHYRGGAASVPELAAAYAFGLIKDHAFIDGNKRTALLVADAFCARNGHRFQAPEAEAVVIFRSVAAGEIGEEGLARWFTRHTQKVEL